MISYLSDMDGVLIKEGEMIPGADKFIQSLYDNDIEFMVLTNNSMSTPRDLSARLKTRASTSPRSAFGPPPRPLPLSSPPKRARARLMWWANRA